MKQHITKEQWNELLNPEKQMEFIIALKKKPEIITYEYKNRSDYPRWGSVLKEVENFRPSVGEMIEFLGDDLKRLEYIDNDLIMGQERMWVIWFGKGRSFERFHASELTAVLWEKVKYKLK